jgi:hypothetical protein
VSILCKLTQAQDLFVSYNDPNIVYEGRFWTQNDAAVLSWSGNSASITFNGTSISAVMLDLDTANYYNVIVDGNVVSKFHSEMTKRSYLLANNLPAGKHTVQLFKRTEWDKGKTYLFGFEAPKGTKILPSPLKKRKIEFYGNSITCGYANEDNSGSDSWFGYYQNAYLTYAAITARHFDAQYSSVSKSGIGITVSWFPLIEKEMYDRTDATDPNSKWDFSKYTPDLVVVNLFQNDSWLVNMPNHDSFKLKFGTQAPDKTFIISEYKDFIASIRAKYPNASIICALGSMDATKEGSAWPGYIQEAVNQLNDSKIYTHFFPYKGTSGHPNVNEQKTMADDLIAFIEQNIKW